MEWWSIGESIIPVQCRLNRGIYFHVIPAKLA